MKESIVTITPIPDEAAKVVGEVNHLLKGFSGPTLKSVGTGGGRWEQVEILKLMKARVS